MKILMITLRADIGGGPEHLFKLLENRKPDWDYYAACPMEAPYYERYVDLLGQERVFVLPHRKLELKAVWGLMQLVSREGIDWVHSHGKGAGIYSRILRALKPVRVLHTFHGLHLGYSREIFNRLYCWLERFFCSYLTDFMICVSKTEKNNILRHKIASDRIQVIENGVSIPPDLSRKEPESHPLRVLHVSRFDVQKNSELLLPIARQIVEEDLPIVIDVIGQGEGQKDLRESLSREGLLEVVLLNGPTNEPASWFLKSDAYLSTSRWEGLPMAVLEAFSCGLPCVLSEVTGHTDFQNEESGALFYSLEKPLEAVLHLGRLAKDKAYRQSLGQKSRKLAETRYSAQRMARDTWNLLSQLSQNFSRAR